jgi:glycosyltransferase involved in cell wall biosynthesis
LRDLVAEHRRAPFDVLQAFWAGIPGAVGAIAGVLLRRPVALHLAGGELAAIPDLPYGDLWTRRGRLLRRVATAGAARITAASAPMIQAASAVGLRTQLLPLGVDLGAWRPRSPRPRPPTGPARLVQVASLNRVKDQPTLLHACARLRAAGVDFTLDIIGEDTLGGEIQRLAGTLGLSDRVVFHGFLPQQRCREIVEAADLMLISSRHEAGPIALLEAAAVGVPAVGTAVGHVAEWAPMAAVAVPTRDPDAMSAAIVALLADDARRLDLAREAQSRAVQYDADWTARELERMYDELTHTHDRAK